MREQEEPCEEWKENMKEKKERKLETRETNGWMTRSITFSLSFFLFSSSSSSSILLQPLDLFIQFLSSSQFVCDGQKLRKRKKTQSKAEVKQTSKKNSRDEKMHEKKTRDRHAKEREAKKPASSSIFCYSICLYEDEYDVQLKSLACDARKFVCNETTGRKQICLLFSLFLLSIVLHSGRSLSLSFHLLLLHLHLHLHLPSLASLSMKQSDKKTKLSLSLSLYSLTNGEYRIHSVDTQSGHNWMHFTQLNDAHNFTFTFLFLQLSLSFFQFLSRESHFTIIDTLASCADWVKSVEKSTEVEEEKKKQMTRHHNNHKHASHHHHWKERERERGKRICVEMPLYHLLFPLLYPRSGRAILSL